MEMKNGEKVRRGNGGKVDRRTAEGNSAEKPEYPCIGSSGIRKDSRSGREDYF